MTAVRFNQIQVIRFLYAIGVDMFEQNNVCLAL